MRTSLLPEKSDVRDDSGTRTLVTKESAPEESSEGWKHADWELGRRLVGEVNGGEEAAVREVLLDR